MTPEGNMAPPRSWWSRNWKWAVPVGCLGLIGSCGCLTAVLVGFGYSAAKSSTPYEQALAAAKADSVVQATLGPPIESSFNSQMSVQMRDGQSVAEFSVPLHGSKQEGLLRVEATKQGGQWSYQVFQVEVQGQPPIQIQDKASGTPRLEEVPPDIDTPPDSPAPEGGEEKPDIKL